MPQRKAKEEEEEARLFGRHASKLSVSFADAPSTKESGAYIGAASGASAVDEKDSDYTSSDTLSSDSGEDGEARSSEEEFDIVDVLLEVVRNMDVLPPDVKRVSSSSFLPSFFRCSPQVLCAY